MTTYIEVKNLPNAVQRALNVLSYNKKDIGICYRDSAYLGGCSGDGQKAYSCIVDLPSNQYKIEYGSWGGSNMFVTTNVDDGKEPFVIPENTVVINGHIGHQPWATLIAREDMKNLFYQGSDEEPLSSLDIVAINAFVHNKSGEYRNNYIRRCGITKEHIDSLVARGYLKQSKNGATQATTKAKNVECPEGKNIWDLEKEIGAKAY